MTQLNPREPDLKYNVNVPAQDVGRVYLDHTSFTNLLDFEDV